MTDIAPIADDRNYTTDEEFADAIRDGDTWLSSAMSASDDDDLKRVRADAAVASAYYARASAIALGHWMTEAWRRDIEAERA